MPTLNAFISRTLGRLAPHDATLRLYTQIALVGCAVDLLTKELAERMLADHSVALGKHMALMLVWNLGAAGGVQLGPFTATLNVLVTVLAIGMVMVVVRPIAAIDRRAPLPLGLVTGGALGNLLSIVVGPEGVADFLAVPVSADTTIVVNVADLLLWSGSLLLVPVVVRLLAAHRAERAAKMAPLAPIPAAVVLQKPM
ncbi:MAG: signal peptidase II [Gemmatimonadetes bacterium]|nr:signal peptidase II [Gemmatimonadota bacterium]